MRGLLNHWWAVPFVIAQIGDPFGGDGGIFGGLLQGLYDAIIAILSFLWNVLVYVANFLLAVVNFIWHFLLRIFGDIKAAFQWIWKAVIKAGLTKLVNLFLKVRAWLKQTLQPVIDILKKIRKWYDDFFNKYVKPFLNLIRHVRQVLQLFRLLGFKWAARLDADLALVEKKVAEVFTTLRKYLNLAITWIDLIVDPLGILRRNPLFASIIRSAAELQNVLYAATQRPLTGAESDSAKQDAARYTLATQKANYQNYYSQRKVPPCIEESRQRFLVELKAIQNG